MTTRDEPDMVPLDELIQRLRAGLESGVRKRGTDFKPLFNVAEATVETGVNFSRSAKGGGKLSIHIAEIGGEGTERRAADARITIKLVPIDSRAGRLPLEDERAVAGKPATPDAARRKRRPR